MAVCLTSLTVIPWKVRSSQVSGLVNQVINVTIVVDDLTSNESESLLCEANVPFIKFIEDNSELDSLLGIYIYIINTQLLTANYTFISLFLLLARVFITIYVLQFH